jgi:hypothetical protein
MNCQELELDLALYAGGDLEDAAAVDGHLAGCAACRGLVAELRELRDDLAALREVELPSLPAIRPRRSVRWPWMAGAIAAGLALFAVLRPADVAPPPRLAWAPAAPVVEIPRRRPIRPPVRHAAPVLAVPAPETDFVKLVTDDEDVVILWAMNSKGELP